jgi:FeS assembly SUF system protein
MEVAAKTALETKVIDVLKTCYDPEIPSDIYSIGLIYDIAIDDEANVHVLMTLTSPSCPVAETLPPEVEDQVRSAPGVNTAEVEITWDPPWTMDMMSDEARLELDMF